MSIDPQISQLLQAPRPDGTYFGLDPLIARATLDEMVKSGADAFPPMAGIDRSDVTIGNIGVRLYRPSGTGQTGLCPLLILAHGGGWVVGNIASHDRLFAQIAQRAGCCVASVEYRLAPEARFPAQIDDLTAVFRHMQSNALKYGVDAGRIAVGGDSAGATLAAALSLTTRADGGTPPLFQLLVYPVADLSGSYPSRDEFSSGPMFSAKELQWYIDSYLPNRDVAADFRASPLRAADLSGLPPAIIVTAGHDMLRDEGLAYGHALMAAGNRVTALHYPTMVHGFLMFADIADAASRALDDIAQSIRSAFRA